MQLNPLCGSVSLRPMTPVANSIAISEVVRPARRPPLLIGILGFGVFLGLVIFSIAHPVHDFVEYWTAAHLLVAHHNPYSLNEVFRMEREFGFEQSVPIMLLSPPWTLSLVAPIGLFKSYALACFFWM